MSNFDFEYTSLPEKGSTVLLGMSGGVDSTVATLMLLDHGCKVIGVTMSMWNDDLPLKPNDKGMRNSCYGPDEALDIAQVKAFCKEHGIEHIVADVRKAYKDNVLDYFKSEYRSGRTPNPCVQCNPSVKFGAMLDTVRSMGIAFDYFCTGHYARLLRPTNSFIDGWDMGKSKNGQYPLLLTNAEDAFKSQTYFLYRIPSTVLEKVRFPLGSMTKADVFEYAKERNLIAADRSESQDFVPAEYLPIILSDKPPIEGDFVDLDGNVLGKHKGIEYYTIGKRRGLGISSTAPLYVHSINVEKNQVVVGRDDDLKASGLFATNWVWAGDTPPTKPFEAPVKIRLASPPELAQIEPTEDKTVLKIIFKKPQKAVAPGQSAVVYYNDTILGGGIITHAIQ